MSYDEWKAQEVAAFSNPRPLTERERFLLTHTGMFGEAGYPVRKCGSRWIHDGSPGVFKTKREALRSCDAYLACLAGYQRAEMAVRP